MHQKRDRCIRPSASLSIILVTATVWSGVLAQAGPAGTAPAGAREALVAHWTFDEPAGAECRDGSGGGHHAACDDPSALTRAEGVFGGAVSLRGTHRLSIPGRPDFSRFERVSLIAWVGPHRFERYNEIFRKEDGDRRVLFSFQEHGRVLSLGLNVGGYVECDAAMEPRRALDGFWHHCAATFDGQVMRVYLDGREIGSLARAGRLAAGGPADGCIGSLNGTECFQGEIDDLRIYREALPAGRIAALYAEGLAALKAAAARAEERTGAMKLPEGPFPQALAALWRQVAGGGQPPGRQLAKAAYVKLRTAFPQECDRFFELAEADGLEFFSAGRPDGLAQLAGRVVELLAEYKPLTEEQWRRQSPADLAKWRQIEAVEKCVASLRALGPEGLFSPRWVEIILDVAPRIARRPRLQEAVAPYVTPSTPPTRDLTEAEAKEALERDWLHQADGNPTPQRIRDEIRWTHELAGRIAEQRNMGGTPVPPAALDELEKRAANLRSPDKELYFAVRRIKRAVAFANPVVDFGKVLLVDMPFPQGSEWRHETRHRLGYMAVPGGRLLVLEGLSPAGRLRQLMPAPPLHGSFWRPDLSWDAARVLFCFKPHNDKSFHLYEIGLDGGGLTQLTDGPYDDLDPIYLPDGRHILFSTTRGHTYVRCMPPTNAYVLARSRRDGRDVYLISRNNEPDYLPSVMEDGRVIYTRWEYTDKPLWRDQSLWTVNPDGTYVSTFWGNQSVWPDLLKDARSIPGSRRVMFTGSAHHDWFSGSVGIIDPHKGFNFPDGLTKVTADVAWPECGNGPVDPVESPRYHPTGRYAAYYSPYPLSERDFLVSAERAGKFVLYLMDTDGNRELVYEGVNHILHALPIRPRALPAVIPDRVDWPARAERDKPAGGILYSANVCQGAPEELRGRAKFLRILNIEHKTYTYWHRRPYISTGPVVSGVQSDGVKRVLGTVPIEPDGSVAFQAPSGLPLHFQLLDERGRALQTMRSFTGVMPGESRGCLGCHELHSTAPELARPAAALARQSSRITPPPWRDDTVSYARYVRPALDRYCARCHQGDGEGRKKLDLTARPGMLGFDETYWLFTGRPTWGSPYIPPANPPPGFGIADTLLVEGYDQRDPAGYRTPPPMARLSFRSRLVERASSGSHHGVRVDEKSLQRLILWVDAICPYLGSEEVRAIDDPNFQGIDWLAIRPRIRTAPTIIRPGPVD